MKTTRLPVALCLTPNLVDTWCTPGKIRTARKLESALRRHAGPIRNSKQVCDTDSMGAVFPYIYIYVYICTQYFTIISATK